MELEKLIIDIISQNLEIEHRVTPKSKLINDLAIDSLTMIMIIDDLENELDIQIDENDFVDLVRVEDILIKLKAKYPDFTGAVQ
jgi:acyl carrier protein